MHNQFKHLMLAMGPRDLNSAPYSPVQCSSHSMTSFQSSELTELPVVENSQLFAQRAHSARYTPTVYVTVTGTSTVTATVTVSATAVTAPDRVRAAHHVGRPNGYPSHTRTQDALTHLHVPCEGVQRAAAHRQQRPLTDELVVDLHLRNAVSGVPCRRWGRGLGGHKPKQEFRTRRTRGPTRNATKPQWMRAPCGVCMALKGWVGGPVCEEWEGPEKGLKRPPPRASFEQGGGGGEGVLDPKLGVPKMA